MSPDRPPLPRIASDSFGSPALGFRQYDEGVSNAHFSVAGARLTGNAPIAGAPTVLLVGDSYVAAVSVADDETMGARLERDARAAGVPINVRQYGWTGASPSRYLLEAPELLARWNPTEIVIVLSDNDLDFNALHEAIPRLRVSKTDTLEIIGPLPPRGADHHQRSALAEALRLKTLEFKRRLANVHWINALLARGLVPSAIAATSTVAPGDRMPESDQLERLPRAVVHNLHATFGDRLSLLYIAEVGISGGTTPSVIERRLLDACGTERVRCATTRRTMIAARNAGTIGHGFANTTPGNGHLNADGHRLAGDLLWSMVR